MMKVDKAVLYWNPGTDFFDISDIDDYRGVRCYTVGYVFSDYRTLTNDEKIMSIMANAITVIVRDQMDPKLVVSKIMEKLPEVANYFPEDILS